MTTKINIVDKIRKTNRETNQASQDNNNVSFLIRGVNKETGAEFGAGTSNSLPIFINVPRDSAFFEEGAVTVEEFFAKIFSDPNWELVVEQRGSTNKENHLNFLSSL